jgi:hypothetical protein
MKDIKARVQKTQQYQIKTLMVLNVHKIIGIDDQGNNAFLRQLRCESAHFR